MIEWKVTTAVVLAIGLEAAGLFLWAGAASERLKELELRVAGQAQMAERLARVEVHLQMATAQLNRIEKKLEAS
jgi:nicotinamide riboside transporter PnuC